MSSQKFVIPFDIPLKPSFMLLALLLFLYGGAVILTMFLSWPWWLKFVISLLVMVSLFDVLRRCILFRGRKAVVSLHCDGKGGWQLRCASGEQFEAKLASATSMQPWLAMMNFHAVGERRRWSVVVMADSIDSTTFRRLHVRLRDIARVQR